MSFLEVTAFLFDGFKISLLIFAVTLLLGAPLGLPIAFCSMSRFKPVKAASKIIVWIVRGVPLMLQIFIIYYVPGLLFDAPIFSQMDRFFFINYGISDAGRIIAVLLAFTINYACYFSEIYRGGIEAIPRGQIEAGQVLGMSRTQIFFRVTLLQVIKRILPPISNEVITLVKDTSLANIIAVSELFRAAKNEASRTASVEPLFVAGLFYLLMNGVVTLVFSYLTRRYEYYKD